MRRICGIDEAGRGPLAGPVFAAAVILPRRFSRRGLGDSKTLTAAQREELYIRIMNEAHVGVGEASVAEIDAVNILQATFLAMRRAFDQLAQALGGLPDEALIDGNRLPRDFPTSARAIIDGDALEPSISAASIIAKVTRDRLMMQLHDECPAYGWVTNKGYGTREHCLALERHGPTRHHRLSFEPLRQFSLL